MTGEEQAQRRVTRMSNAQRDTLLRALLAARASRPPRAGTTPCRPAPTKRLDVADPHRGPEQLGDGPALVHLAPLFESTEWRAAWQPGEEHHVYVIGCTGLGQLAAATGAALAKVGTSAVGSLDRRLRDLRRQAYGSVARHGSEYRTDLGWDDWAPFRKLQLAPTPAASPVRVSTYSLILTAPRGWSAGEVEATVNAALTPCRLQVIADSDAGRVACRKRGVDPATLVRYSRIRAGVEAATELTMLRPQADAPRLASTVALAVARLVRAGAPTPNAPAWSILN